MVGAGSWGTTVASIAARTVPAVLWARRDELAARISRDHENSDYLPGLPLPAELRATASLGNAVEGASLVVMAVPSHGFRQVVTEMVPYVEPGVPVLSLAKGLEEGTHRRMTQVLAELLPASPSGVLTGPNLAREVLTGQPAATVVAMHDLAVASRIQDLLTTGTFRVYTNPDVVGCEMAGATKNVIAIAAGISDGLGFGDSTRAALITRGLAELARLGAALGGDRLTFAGLAGVGDLVATCTSHLSRNRTVGEQLGRGRSIQDVVAGMQMVAEGVKTAHPLLDLARANDVEMPISEQVAAVLDGLCSPAEALHKLMGRSAKPEFEPVHGSGRDPVTGDR